MSKLKNKDLVVFTAANTTPNKIRITDYNDNEDDDSIEELMRINGLLNPSSQRPNKHDAIVTPRKGAATSLPAALLKLDQQHDIPTLRHDNDVLIEIEAFTVEQQDQMVPQSGLRGDSTFIETTSADCIGRVVQIASEDGQQQHDIRVNDRIATVYPFQYKLYKMKNRDRYNTQQQQEQEQQSTRYTLADARYIIKIPNDQDVTSAACVTRLYTTAFQSIQLGLYNNATNQRRYSLGQLVGKSILIQNGTSQLGRAYIELCKALGAKCIYATGATTREQSILHDELNVIPLLAGGGGNGDSSFSSSWQMLIEEEVKLNLILIQEFPNGEEFDLFFSILDDTRGVVVYCSPLDGEDSANTGSSSELGALSGVGCSGTIPSFQDLANKAQNILINYLRMTCSPQYVTYPGLRTSCKKDPKLFRNDLSFMFKLLGEGKLKPRVEDCISPEDILSVQNRIESMDGKKQGGTIVCLPAPLYEKKKAAMNNNVVSSFNNYSSDDISKGWYEDCDDAVSYADSYAADSGYIASHYKVTNQVNDWDNVNPIRPRLSSHDAGSLASSSSGLAAGGRTIEWSQSFSTHTSSVSNVSVAKANDSRR